MTREILPENYKNIATENMTIKEKVDSLLTRGVVDVIDRESLSQRLLNGEKLRVKFGINPTGPDIHIGRGSTIRKLREFQELGHTIILIIGDGTARIGDASDKTEGRKLLAEKEILENEQHYLEQIGRIINLDGVEIHHNSEWIDKLDPKKWIELASLFTIQQMVQRDNFSQRIKNNNPVGYQEGLYCLLQGWDSVMVKADVEIGGTDQLFNLNAGRKIQDHFGQKPQDVMMLQLLAGTDGRKMSTSWGNVILVTDSPEEKFGKIMRLSDQLIPVYMEVATMIPMQRVREVHQLLEEGDVNPMELKKELAHSIVTLYNGEDEAKRAQGYFEKTVQAKQTPEEVPSLTVSAENISVTELFSYLVRANLVKSKSEAKRLLQEGAISVDGARLDNNPEQEIRVSKKELMIQVGKRRFLKLTPET